LLFIVVTPGYGGNWYLRGTTWTGEQERANKFTTHEAALTALNRARRFMKPAAFKAATIVKQE